MRTSSLILSAVILLNTATPALARDFQRSVETGKRINTDCARLEGTFRGKCITDVLKQWSREIQQFREVQEKERKSWNLEHGKLGVTAEYRTALKEFLAKQRADKKAFNERQKMQRDEFYARLGESPAGDSTNNGVTRRLNSSQESEARKKCADQKDTTALRICMRQQLRIHSAKVIRRGTAQ